MFMLKKDFREGKSAFPGTAAANTKILFKKKKGKACVYVIRTKETKTSI